MKSQNDLTIAPEKPVAAKIAYIDHLKVLCTILVVLHHSFITYGAPGGWYYQQKSVHMAAQFPMTIFVATNQSFFMGFFFFLSALFVAPSYQKKGTAKFITDRLKRLGIPLVFYSLILSPILIYLVQRFGKGASYSFTEFLAGFHDWIDFGVLWFVAALLIFNLVYLLLQNIPWRFKFKWPTNVQLLLIGILIGLASFITRLWFPTGLTLQPLGFQLGYFPQYIVFFIAGLIASNNKWLDQLSLKQGKSMKYMAIIMIVIVLPALFVWYLAVKFPINSFNGGWNVVSLAYSLWEQVTGVMISVALLCIAKFKWNDATPFSKKLSANAFAVYIFHPLVLISLALLAQSWAIYPEFKLLIVGPAAVIGSFLFAALIRKIKVVRDII